MSREVGCYQTRRPGLGRAARLALTSLLVVDRVRKPPDKPWYMESSTKKPIPASTELPSDLELMLGIRDGDSWALDCLISRYWQRLVRYAVRLGHSSDTAQDVVQEAFIRVWETRTPWRPIGTPQAFLYRIVRNLTLQEYRHREVTERHGPEIVRRHSTPSTPFQLAAESELDHALQDAIAALPERRREAFVLTRYHDLSQAEVAEIMGLSLQTVANHVSMAMASLRKSLEQFLT